MTIRSSDLQVHKNNYFKNRMISLEKVFLSQARSLNDKINAVQLRRILKRDDGSSFDQKLCNELVYYYGTGGCVNIDDFDQIWTLLHKRKIQFQQRSRGKSVLTPHAFKSSLENEAGQEIPMRFLKEIMKFYNGTISIDAFVHSMHHVRKISSYLDLNEDSNILMKEFERSVSKLDFARSTSTQIHEETIIQEIEIKRITCQRLLISYN